MKFWQFLKSRGPLIAFTFILIYGFFVFIIYYSGYQALPTHLDRLPVTVVNQDKPSAALARQLKTTLPFNHVRTTTNLKQARRDLNTRKTYLLVTIPQDFAADVRANRHVTLRFYLNESNQMALVSGLKTVAQRIGTTVNQQIATKKTATALAKPALTQLQRKLAAGQKQLAVQAANGKQAIAAAPVSQRATLETTLDAQLARGRAALKRTGQQQTTTIQSRTTAAAQATTQSVGTQVIRVHPVKSGINHALAPFIANLALYLGTLLGTMVLYGTYVKFAHQLGRLRAFFDLELTMAVLAVLGGTVVTGGLIGIMGLTAHFGGLIATHSLLIFAAYNLNSVLVLLMGQAGMSLNIFLTMIQVVAGAGMVPVVTMNAFFRAAHVVSPMYYGIASDFNLFYGGGSVTADWAALVGLSLGLMVLNAGIVWLRKHPTMLQFSQLS